MKEGEDLASANGHTPSSVPLVFQVTETLNFI